MSSSSPSPSNSVVGSSSSFNQQYSTVSAQFRRCSSLSSTAADLTITVDAKSAATKMRHYSLKQVENPFLVKKSFLALSTSQQGQSLLTLPERRYRSSTLKSQHTGCSVPRQWSRMRIGLKRPKVLFRMTSRKSNGRYIQKTTTGSNRLQVQDLSSEKTSREEIDTLRHDNIRNLHLNSSSRKIKGEILLNTNLSQKYQPKLFPDITGHEITVKAISKAVEKMKIARLYLFHGPSGTGKTSTARIFAMALNCESTSRNKPCWSCRGCSRSLYIMELCSGSRIAGFERIKTLLQSTSFTLAIPGFKVLIIKECQSFNAEAWDELLGIAERGFGSRVIFVLITTDANMVPQNISSRCQKFCFPKLKDREIMLKLAKIVACENIRIQKEALKLIAVKAEGSLREAENLLDQLSLLGSTITSSRVQQLVGLLPQSKLLDLLSTAISGDNIKTIRYTRELITTGVEPQVLVSQLASLITDILSHAAVADSSSSTGSSKDKRPMRRSQLTNAQSERLCHALKILVETERQLGPSIDQKSRILAALLEITSENPCDRMSTGVDIVLPRDVNSVTGGTPNVDLEDMHGQRLFQRKSDTRRHSMSRTSEQPQKDIIEPGKPIKSMDQTQRSRGKEVEMPNLAQTSDMEEIWQNMLGKIESRYMKELLCHQVKLASLTISRANVIIHLIFEKYEDKMEALMSEKSISKALKNAIGCPVTVNMSLQPVDSGIAKGNTVSTNCQSSSPSKQQQRIPFLTDFFHSRNSEAAMHQNTVQESHPLSEYSRPTKFRGYTPPKGPGRCLSEEKTHAARPQKTSHLLGLLTQENQLDASKDPETDTLTGGQTSIDTAHIMTANKPKHRWLSLSSIPQSDASVEPYSQDIFFEQTHKERESNTIKNHKFRKGFLKTAEGRDSRDSTMYREMNYSWSCTDLLCSRKTKGKTNEA